MKYARFLPGGVAPTGSARKSALSMPPSSARSTAPLSTQPPPQRPFDSHKGGARRKPSLAVTLLRGALGILLVSGIGGAPVWAAESMILAQFHPYRQGAPRLPGLEPGVTLSPHNAPLAREVLPAEVLRLLEAGDLSITIQDTTDLPPRPSYLDATLQYSQNVTLNGKGTLGDYRAGAPFPLLDPADPQVGEKLAWDLRYRDLGETFEMQANPRAVNPSGGVEHSNRGHMRFRFGMYRSNPADNDLQWQEQGIFMKNSFEMLAPSDQEGAITIQTKYDDDRATEQWRYAPQNRRTRKDYVNYLNPIGGRYEMLLEEQPPLFFQGYVHSYEWTFRGARVMLVPGFLRTTALRYGGKNGWYPQVPWELRHVLVLECTPRQVHPFGKRVFFLDQQTYTPLMILAYSPAGAFVRLTLTAHAHPSFHPGSNGVPLPLMVGSAWINYAKDRATLFGAGDSMTYNRPLAAQRFELMEILRKGK